MKKLYPKNAAVIIISLIIILFACKKSIQSNPGDGNGSGTGTGNGSVQGVVTDLNNSPVSNATVTGGTATATTDASGKFTLTKVQFSADTVVVIVTKNNFFEGAKSFASSNHAVSNATIQLIPKTVSGNFSATSGGNITTAGGGSVSFGSGFVTASNGNAYSGSVSVSSRYLDPTDQNFSAYAPGELKAVSSNNPQGTLQSFGVVAVEMNDASGNKLQLAPGKTATITLPISSALLNKAPASVPLWYFDDTKGAWKQEGVATKQGSNYIGVVSHFTFWNAGDLAGSVNLTVTFIDSIYSKPSAYRLVVITRPDLTSRNDYTDSSGKITGLVPVNEILNMKVLDTCGTILYSQNIGPFSSDTYLGIIKVAFTNCNRPGTPVAGFTYSVSGPFVPVTVTFSNTSTNATAWIWNFGDGTNSTVQNPSHTYSTAGDYTVKLKVTGPDGKTDSTFKILHLISQSNDTYITLTLNGVSYSWVPSDSLLGDRVADTSGSYYTHIQGGGDPWVNRVKSISFNINTGNNTAPGNYPIYILSTLNDTTYTSSFTNHYNLTTNVTEYGAVNGYITGTASGDMTLYIGSGTSNPVIIPFSCSYRVKRRQ